MAKEYTYNIRVNSDGDRVMNNLVVSARQLTASVAQAQSIIQKSFRSITDAFATTSLAFNNGLRGLEQLSAPVLQFDEAMRAANTMAAKGAEDFAKLKDQVRDLSKAVPVARDLLANGLYQTISNGVPESNWISFLEQSARSSVGGLANLEEVVKVTSTVIKNYGLEWNAAGDIQDKIQLTAKNGVTSFEQLAQALPKVTGNAATLGVQINELLASYSTLTGVSGNTAEVSTQLGAIFTSLVKPTKEASKMAKAMGIEFNAASIKAAGGFGNFLTNLDAAVKQYANANGVLEQAVYGKLFGSAEALRAIGPLIGQLSNKYQENVAEMANSSGVMDEAFETMAESGQNTTQRLKNYFAGLSDTIGGAAASILPYAQFLFNAGMSINGLGAITKTTATIFTAFTGVLGKFNIIQKTCAATTLILRTAMGGLRSVAFNLNDRFKALRLGFSMVTRSGSGMVRLLKVSQVAIKGIVSSLGVWSLALAGIYCVAKPFIDYNNRIKEVVFKNTEAFQEFKKSLTDTSGMIESSVGAEIASLKRLYTIATDETKSRRERRDAANSLKETYKDTFKDLQVEAIMAGKAASAYNQLSKSIIEVAKANAAKAKVAENESLWIELDKEQDIIQPLIDAKRKELEQRQKEWEAASNRTTTTSYYVGQRRGKDAAAHLYGQTQRELIALENRLDEVQTKKAAIIEDNKALEKYYTVANTSTPAIAPQDDHTNLDDLLKDSDSKKTYKQQLEAKLAAAKDSYVKSAVAGNDAEAASIKTVIDVLRQQLAQIEIIEAKAERPATLTTLEDIDAEIRYQQSLRSKAGKENIAAIDAEIKRLEELRKEHENAGANIKSIDQIKTYKDLDAAIQHYQDKMQTANEAERIEIQKTINALEKLREKWDQSLRELNAPGDISSLDTTRKLADAISYYESKMEDATESEIAGYQRAIIKLKEKQSLTRRGVTIAEMQNEIGNINGQHGSDWYVKVNALGFDTLTEKIREAQNLLKDTQNPMSEEMKSQTRDVIEQYKLMQAASLASNAGLQRVWGSTKGVASGFSTMKNAIEESDNAWEKVSGTIDGAIQVYESARQIIEIMTVLTQAISLAKKSETKETEANIAVTTEEAAAKIAASTAEQAAAAANTTAQVGEAAGKTMAAHASIPFVGIAMAGAMVAAMIGIMASLPKFADGGIAYGPTVGMFGEYAGASHNPEVVAPLDKLRGMLNPVGAPVIVGGTLRASGRDLVCVLANETRIASKSGKKTNIKL